MDGCMIAAGEGLQPVPHKTNITGGIKEQRIYLGNFEIYRKFTSSSLTEEWTTLHITDDTGRIAMLERRTVGTTTSLTRYIYSNHLQSSSLELDEDGDIISYEEYHPFGTTSYQAMDATINASFKRYRYTGKERDDESGLYCHGARYYIPWLCRWSAVDPMESKYAGMSSYNYSFNNPTMVSDPDGEDPNPDPKKDKKPGTPAKKQPETKDARTAKNKPLPTPNTAEYPISTTDAPSVNNPSVNTSVLPGTHGTALAFYVFSKRPIKGIEDGYGFPESHSYTVVVRTTKENFEKLRKAYSTDPGEVQDNPYADYSPIENPLDNDNKLEVGDGMDIKIGYLSGKFLSGQVKFTKIEMEKNSFSISASTIGKDIFYKNHPDAGNITFSANFDPKTNQMKFNISNETTIGNFIMEVGQGLFNGPRHYQRKQWEIVIGNVVDFIKAKPKDVLSKTHESVKIRGGSQQISPGIPSGVPIPFFKVYKKTSF